MRADIKNLGIQYVCGSKKMNNSFVKKLKKVIYVSLIRTRNILDLHIRNNAHTHVPFQCILATRFMRIVFFHLDASLEILPQPIRFY